MDLAASTKLGPYEIVSAIGAGGMGEVYRARDTRLDRCVAIKILPSHLACSPELKARFEREARTLSSVSHPNICHLYDVGSQSGVDFLVMELLEGETLSDRLRKGPLPLNDLLRISIEVTEALAQAHRLGLVHRDLKPSNVMLTKTGAKLMDFGLAKPASGDPLSALTPSCAETLTTLQRPASPLTTAGAIVGTLPYMSPEQIEGKEANVRSDIFALGAVLYEMATGQRAFDGKSRVSVASAILEKNPAPAINLNSSLPPTLSYLIHTCLAKDPDQRVQAAQDINLQLRWLVQAGAESDRLRDPVLASNRRRMALGLGGAVLVGLIFLAFRHGATTPAANEYGVVRFGIALPPKQELAADITQSVVISPDGKHLAYIAAESGVPHLYVRRLDQADPIAIPDSESANFPFFSPNGEWVVFFGQGKLKKVPSDGGVPVALAEVSSIFGGVWTPRDVIVLSIPNQGMATVSPSGGAIHKVSVATKQAIYPQGMTWVRGGDWIIYTDYLQPRRSLMALKLATGEIRTILDNAQSASVADGNLLYYQGGALWAVPFDEGKMEVSGTTTQILDGINETNYLPQVSISRTGAFAYAPGAFGNASRNLFLVNRKGDERKLDLPPKDYIDPAFSPDGKRIALAIRSLQQLEVLDLNDGATTNLATNFNNYAPTWALDGKSLVIDAFDATRQHGIYCVAVDGSAEPELLKALPQTGHVTSIAGNYAAVMVTDPENSIDLWLLSMKPPFELRPFKRTPAVERQGSLSPDGRWLAYASNESGRSQIYVEPVPGPGGLRQLSSEGGDQPRWVRNGREIIYRNGTKTMSIPVQLDPELRPGKPVELFDRKFDPGAAVAGYDVSPDGQTFIMTRSERENPTQIRVVLGWPGRPQQR